MTLSQPLILDTHKARDYSDRNGHPIQFIVIHHTGSKGSSLGWLKGNPSGTSIHILIERDGTCYRMVPDAFAAHHVGFSRYVVGGKVYAPGQKGQTCNEPSLGIEIENAGDGKEGYPEAQLKSAAFIIQDWRNKYGPLPILRHGDIDQRGKYDPINLTAADILKYIERSDPITPPPDPCLVTADSAILSPPRATQDQAIDYLASVGTDRTYTKNDARLITHFYWTLCGQAGLDPLIAFSQMIHETGHLTSWWSLRPRRNPAGIGVTGETSRNRQQPGVDWSFDLQSKLWKRGYSFASWDISVLAHAAHLLVYCVPEAQMTDAQKRMLPFDPRRKDVPAAIRGTVRSLKELDGRWAVPGVGYGAKIASIANIIRGR